MTSNPLVEEQARPGYGRFAVAGVVAWLAASYGAAAWFLLVGEAPLSFLADPGPLLLVAFVPIYGLAQGWAPLTGAFLAWAALHGLATLTRARRLPPEDTERRVRLLVDRLAVA